MIVRYFSLFIVSIIFFYFRNFIVIYIGRYYGLYIKGKIRGVFLDLIMVR